MSDGSENIKWPVLNVVGRCDTCHKPETGETVPVQLRYAIAKGRDRAVVHDLIVLALSLSTPSTDACALRSGSNVLEGTFHMGQMGRAAGSDLLDEEGLADTRIPAMEYARQLFHLPAACGPTHIGTCSRDGRHHSFEVLYQGQEATGKLDVRVGKRSGDICRE